MEPPALKKLDPHLLLNHQSSLSARDNHSEQLQASAWSHNDVRVCRFLVKSGAAYGLQGATPDDLDDAGRETLAEVALPAPSLQESQLRHQILHLAQHVRIPRQVAWSKA